MKSPRAFTLVELLTTVALVGILAALITPMVGKMQRSARMASSQSNLRQAGVLIQSYVTENGKYPHGSDSGLGSWLPCHGQIEPTWRGYWSDILSPYLGKDSWWGSDTSAIFDSPAKLIKTASKTRAFTPNPNIIQDTQWGGGLVIPVSKVGRPSEIILLGDAVQNSGNGEVSHLPWQHPGIYDSAESSREDAVPATTNVDDGSAQFRFRYDNKGHFLFADGHVEQIRNGQLKKKNFSIAY